MEDTAFDSEEYDRIERAILFIEDNFTSQPSLEAIAASVNLSKFHFNRLFKRWAGVSPLQFQQYMTLEYTKHKLAQARSVLEAAHDVGLSGPGRLHDLFVNFEAMTPGEYKKQGRGLTITYGFGPSPFGECLLATTPRGICSLGFVQHGDRQDVMQQLFDQWPGAMFTEDGQAISLVLDQVFNRDAHDASRSLNLVVKGTNFQVNVWKALLAIQEGAVVSYQDVATSIGKPKAFRAVASAIARNPIGYLIPCHRVISKAGRIHHYRWGHARKSAMVGWEAAVTRDISRER
ncbi:methylated-DNA--[protein]-cysteine S-methyltransferase [Pseudodesulfovibrio sp. JC047]|uniref:bifunctional transcriptional activator/DNA repair enzyme AdaA n=1 Tax=Pseudodesulfovibrio sp. JC047 TaxID=2683199 RepID=UPI0013CFD205|nr:methylated-DNA--[protein]-cysteine S-methyltransferase [Pseudodesulfovibrio sp. JC047]NDV19961.1 methylated-DNA--[protein]-cysteine S-methyltransferase [Pseudodesulfovibrio sp. JC047]